MKHAAIEKAYGRLRVAQKALAELKACRTFVDFSDAWYVVLTSSKNIYTVLELGAKGSPQSMQWIGAKKQQRKSDALLQYMFQARNDDEHGLGSAVELKPELHEFGLAGPGFSNVVQFDGGPFSSIVCVRDEPDGAAVAFESMSPPSDLKVTSLDGKPVGFRRTPATTILMPVTGRDNRTYHPPTVHLGQSLQDTSPVAVAELNIAYLRGLLAEAEELA